MIIKSLGINDTCSQDFIYTRDFCNSAVNNTAFSAVLGLKNGLHWHLLTNTQAVNRFCNRNKYQQLTAKRGRETFLSPTQTLWVV